MMNAPRRWLPVRRGAPSLDSDFRMPISACSRIDGFGLGLRPPHYAAIADGSEAIDWLELLSENFMVEGGRPLYWLDRIAERYPVVLHGVSMSIGGCDPLDRDYLRQLAALAQRCGAHWISDHLCWTGVDRRNLHDLMPLPFTEEAVAHVAGRVRQVQDMLDRRILLENVSSYASAAQASMHEWEFLAAVSEAADCHLLLDVNNVHVSAHNHRFDPLEYLDGVPAARVRQIHLAGHSRQRGLLIDTHDAPVCAEVWALYRQALQRFGPVPTMIERDDNIPALAELVAELEHARAVAGSLARAA